MSKRILIVRKEGRHVVAKIRSHMNRGYAPDDYNKLLNPHDFNDLALLFEDLDLLMNAPIDKAYKKYLERKNGKFPFF